MPPELTAAERLDGALEFAWELVGDLWPYIVGGVLVAALFRQVVPSQRLRAIARGRGALTLVSAAVLGIISPLCTYGTIPILYQLCRSGAPVGPSLAFVVASSLANPQVLALTYGALGPWMAGARVIASLFIALGVGMAALRIDGGTLLNRNAIFHDGGKECSHRQPHRPNDGKGFDLRRFAGDFMDIGGYIGLYFLIGLLISGFAKYFIPREWLNWILGSNHWWGIVIATTLGAPFYACGGGSIPTVQFLIGNDLLDPGGGLAFLTAGPALRLSCLAALAAFLNRRALVAYVIYIFLAALLFGAVFSLLTHSFPWMIRIEDVVRIPNY